MSAQVIPLPPPRVPPLTYRLQNVVILADLGYGHSPRYTVDLINSDGCWASSEWSGDDGREALRVGLRVADDYDDRHGVRIEFYSYAIEGQR